MFVGVGVKEGVGVCGQGVTTCKRVCGRRRVCTDVLSGRGGKSEGMWPSTGGVWSASVSVGAKSENVNVSPGKWTKRRGLGLGSVYYSVLFTFQDVHETGGTFPPPSPGRRRVVYLRVSGNVVRLENLA